MEEPEDTYQFVVDVKAKRLDAWLAERVTDVSRNRLRDLITRGFVTVNGTERKPSVRLAAGDQIEVTIPPPLPIELIPEDIPLDVLFEDEHVIVINKTAGLVVHPARGNQTGTLVQALLFHCKDIAGVGGEERPGIVHRLDKDTSGVMVAAKTDIAHRRLQDQFRERTVSKQYFAICRGVPNPPTGTVNAPLDRHPQHRKKRAICEGGREAITHYEVVGAFDSHASLAVRIETGRTHQIRVHLASIGHPVIGDVVYGGKQPGFDAPRQLLHAHFLEFDHPDTSERMRFEAPAPPEFAIWTA